MERLTNKAWRNFDPWECCGQDNFCTRGCHEKGGCNNGCIVPKLYGRLAAYEDTGLEPEEIYEVRFLIAAQRDPQKLARLRELVLADQNGRLVVLPWAVGDVIYEADPAHGVVKHTFAEEAAWMMHSYAKDDDGNEWYDGWGSSDETPFYTTREEAEAALNGKGGEG